MDDQDTNGLTVHEALYAKWEEVPIAWIDLYELFLREVSLPVSSNEDEKSSRLVL
jgi:hypothetical protein